MRTTATLVTAGIAEAAAHFLSLGWGFAVLVLAFIVVAARVTTLAAATAGKTYAVEARLNAHIVAAAPAINLVANGGTIGGNVTVNGSHTVTGQVNAAAGSFTGSTTDYGHTTHGTMSSDGDINAGGNANISGQLNSNTASVDGAATTYGLTVHGGISADSSISASNFSGSYAGGQSGVTTSDGTLASTASAVNGCISRMESAGLI